MNYSLGKYDSSKQDMALSKEDHIIYLDPNTNKPLLHEPEQPLPKRMRFAPKPKKIDDRE